MPDLTEVYGEHCKVEQVLVRAFGFERVFVRAGANALLRAAIDAYAVGYPVHSFGAFNCRMTTGGTSWSAHAWAAAVDINPSQNPYSSKGLLRTDMPDAFVAAFTRHGFGWGGAWHGTIKDAMHFSLAPTEGGDGVHEPFDPHLQDAADAAWRGHPPAPPPAPKEAGVTAPPWAHEHPGDIQSVHAGCQTVTTWQQRMQDRGWEIDADGSYGADSEQVCRAFQREKGLHIDGVLGQDTWRAAWETPIT